MRRLYWLNIYKADTASEGGGGGKVKIVVPNQAIGFAKGQLCTRVHSFKTYIIFSLNKMQDTVRDVLYNHIS